MNVNQDPQPQQQFIPVMVVPQQIQPQDQQPQQIVQQQPQAVPQRPTKSSAELTQDIDNELAKLKTSIKKWGLCVKIMSYCGVFGIVMTFMSCIWMEFNAEKWVVHLDKYLADQSQVSDTVTKQQWVLASDMRSICFIGLLVCMICMKALKKALKIVKIDHEKMSQPNQPAQSQEGQAQGPMRGQWSRCKERMQKQKFKNLKLRIHHYIISLSFLAIFGVMYERQIWHAIDPLSDKWSWYEYSKPAYWEKEIDDVEDTVEHDIDEIEKDIDEVEEGIEDHMDEGMYIEEREMDAEDQDLRGHHHDHEHEDHRDQNDKQHDHDSHEQKWDAQNFKPCFVLDAVCKIAQMLGYLLCVRKVLRMKKRFVNLSTAKNDSEGKTEEQKQTILTEAINKRMGCCRKNKRCGGRRAQNQEPQRNPVQVLRQSIPTVQVPQFVAQYLPYNPQQQQQQVVSAQPVMQVQQPQQVVAPVQTSLNASFSYQYDDGTETQRHLIQDKQDDAHTTTKDVNNMI